MASRAHFAFVTDPEALGRFYTEVLHLAPPQPFTINGRPGLTFAFTGGELFLRRSTKPRTPDIDDPLPYRLPADVDLEQVVVALDGQATGVTRGETAKGVKYVELIDPAGVPWRVMAHGR